MSGNLIRTRLKALFLKDDLVNQYIERYGEILNLSFVEQFKEELRCNETGETPSNNLDANLQQAKKDHSPQFQAASRGSHAAKFIRIKLKAIFMKESLVDLYLQRYGEIINQKFIDELKAEAKAMEASGSSVELSNKAPSDAIFEFEYQCPACRYGSVTGYHLRSKSQMIEETLLLVPHYSAFEQYAAVDYSVLQTAVCPKCLFASPDPKDWTRINKFNGMITDSQLVVHSQLLKDIRAQERERLAKYPEAKNDMKYFLRPRTPQKGLESIELSIMRAQLEKEYSLPAVNYKIGKQYLKYADIKARNKEDPNDARKEAENYLIEALKISDCNNLALEMECMYLVIVMSLSTKNTEKAMQFVRMAKDLLIQKQTLNREEPSAELRTDISVIEKWMKRISPLWEFRADASYFQRL
jgi:uncharacterized protein (DUF2225 family)